MLSYFAADCLQHGITFLSSYSSQTRTNPTRPEPNHQPNSAGEAIYTEQVQPLQAAAPPSTRFVLVSATLPQHTFEALKGLFPGLVPAFGPGLHRVSAGEGGCAAALHVLELCV
jgi:hypothetical protein